MATRIYTKTGDGGDTGLYGGTRVPKDHGRVTAYGEVDELNAHLGLARVQCTDRNIGMVLERLQNLLFELGANLATPPPKESTQRVIDADVRWMEQEIDEAEAQLAPLKTFVLPGGCELAASLHIARTVCRRAERAIVGLHRAEPATDPLNIVFINRLADLLFVFARLANMRASRDDVPWQARQA